MMASGTIAPMKHGGDYCTKSSATEELMDAIVQRLTVVFLTNLAGKGENSAYFFIIQIYWLLVSDSKNYLFRFTGKSLVKSSKYFHLNKSSIVSTVRPNNLFLHRSF